MFIKNLFHCDDDDADDDVTHLGEVVEHKGVDGSM